MTTTPTEPVASTGKRPSPYNLKALGRDYGFVLPGFFISLIAFIMLVTLTTTAIPLMIVWVGAVLLPAALWLAGAFADLDRMRLRWWGRPVERISVAPRRPGLRGFVAMMAHPRRWFDLLYETLIGFPLHIVTFSVAVAWTGSALGCITEVFWAHYIPGFEEGPFESGYVLDFLTLGHAPESAFYSLTLLYVIDFITGLILLATLPLVMRGLALLDAAVMGAALAGPRPAPKASNTQVPDGGGPHPSSGTGTVPREHWQGAEVSALGWAWIAAGTFATVLIAVSWPLLSSVYGVHVLLAMGITLGQAAALLLSVRTPVISGIVNVVTVATTVLATASMTGAPWPWPVPSIIAQVVIVAMVALRRPWPWALVLWLVSNAVAVVFAGDMGGDNGALANLIVSASVTFFFGLVSVGIRTLARSRIALQQERRTSAELNAQRQELDERTRIARELHDVVAHSMSVISVQATTAPYRLHHMDQPTRAEFASIADSSRQALSEMRSLLTLLRGSGTQQAPELAPQATLEQIPQLIESTRASGATISAHLDGLDDSEVAPATGLAAYRMVQEGLSNAVRHAPGADIDVSVEITDASVEILVTNGPATRPDAPRSPGAGLGLAGVRERAAAVGGHAQAEPSEDGGFRLSATLPL